MVHKYEQGACNPNILDLVEVSRHNKRQFSKQKTIIKFENSRFIHVCSKCNNIIPLNSIGIEEHDFTDKYYPIMKFYCQKCSDKVKI